MTADEKNIFDGYLVNHFPEKKLAVENTDFLKTWENILNHAAIFGNENAVNSLVSRARPVSFENPGGLGIEIYDSFAGRIPVISTQGVNDFENLVTNIVHKGVRPDNISKTGASFVFGKTTRFIILSDKFYSNVPASELGLDMTDEKWRELSVVLRREHECVHYYTLQNYGVSKNHLHDELMADFFGIHEAFGYYKADFFLHFLGVKGTTGDRLKCYIPDCSDGLYKELCLKAESCAAFLEDWSNTDGFKKMTKAERLDWLCRLELSRI